MAAVRLQRTIWAALLVSILIYCVLAFILGQANARLPGQSQFRDPIVGVLYSVGAVTFVMAFLLRGLFRDRGRPSAYYNIVSWGLFESITIYGLVLALLKHDWRMMAAPVLLTFAGFVITFPDE